VPVDNIELKIVESSHPKVTSVESLDISAIAKVHTNTMESFVEKVGDVESVQVDRILYGVRCHGHCTGCCPHHYTYPYSN
jgi:hypothetical protein